MEKIEFAGVRGDIEFFGSGLIDAIKEVMETGEFISGSHVAEFEDAVCNYLGCKHAIGMSSGSDALLTALHCSGVERGDAVITTPYSFISTVSSIIMLGAVPVYADINPYTYNISQERIKEILVLRDDVRAIVPVHLFGQSCDMESIMRLALEYDLLVIEDACQAFGAYVPLTKKRTGRTGRWNYMASGTVGDVGCFSFHPTKVLGAIGDAGMCVTDNDEIAKHIRAMRNHGQRTFKYQHDELGWNMRMDGVQASVLLRKLNNVDSMIHMRRLVAKKYDALLDDLEMGGRLVTPVDMAAADLEHWTEFSTHVYSQYALRITGGRRDALADHLRKAGVPVGIHYPRAIPEQPMFDPEDQNGRYDTQEAELFSKENLCLPIHPWMEVDQIEYVCKMIHKFYREEVDKSSDKNPKC